MESDSQEGHMVGDLEKAFPSNDMSRKKVPIKPRETPDREKLIDYESPYGLLRLIAKVISRFAWVSILLAVIYPMVKYNDETIYFVSPFYLSFIMISGAITTLLFCEVAKAIADNSDSNAQRLLIAKKVHNIL